MRIGLRILIGTFAIVALTALLLSQVFLAQVKPGVRQAMEDTLVDTANVLAEQAADDMLAGHIDDGRFAEMARMAVDDPSTGGNPVPFDADAGLRLFRAAFQGDLASV